MKVLIQTTRKASRKSDVHEIIFIQTIVMVEKR